MYNVTLLSLFVNRAPTPTPPHLSHSHPYHPFFYLWESPKNSHSCVRSSIPLFDDTSAITRPAFRHNKEGFRFVGDEKTITFHAMLIIKEQTLEGDV